MLQKPSPASHIDGLTGLRGIAALWVFFLHSWQIIIPALTIEKPFYILRNQFDIEIENFTPIFMGWVGVHIFFVLSGFLLFLPFAEKLLHPDKTLSLGYYLKRRVGRILPAYYVQFVILMVLATVGLHGVVPLPGDVMAHLLMIHNFSPAYSFSMNEVYWTLPIEFSFYLLLPLLFLLIKRVGWGIFILSVIGMVIINKLMLFPLMMDKPQGYKIWLFGQLPARLDLFVYGMVAAFLYTKYNHFFRMSPHKSYFEWGLIISGISGLWLMLRYLAVIGGEHYWNGHWSLFLWDTVAGMMIMLLVLGITFNGMLTRMLFANKFILFIGTISYSIYLWHYVIVKLLFENASIIDYINRFAGHEKFIVVIIMVIPLTLIVSALSYRYVELPFLMLGSRKRQLEPLHEQILVMALKNNYLQNRSQYTQTII